jgi:hypothetical protein
MQNEIEYLNQVVYPKISKHCKNIYDVEFQVRIIIILFYP